MGTIARLILLALLASLIGGCAPRVKPEQKAVQISTIRPTPPERKEVVLEVSRERLLEALNGKPGLNTMRLVRVFNGQPSISSLLPEYRLFDIKSHSAYELLGLRNGDVLVSANDYVLFEPGIFFQYVSLFREASDPFIEIRRSGKPVLIRYAIY